MIKKILIATLVCILLQIPFMGIVIAQEPLTISISPSKEVYALGEDMILEVVVHNPNNEETRVMWLVLFEEPTKWFQGQYYGRESIPAGGYYGKSYKIESELVGKHIVHATLYDDELNYMNENRVEYYVEEKEIAFGKAVAIPIILISAVAIIIYKKRVKIRVILSERRRKKKKRGRKKKR